MARVPSFELTTSSLTDALSKAVGDRIVSGDIAPGEKVTEARLVGEYRVARPTAKACVERLTVMGLLRRTVHRTAVVPVLEAADIEDLFLSRSTVELAAVRVLAARSSTPSPALAAQLEIEAAVAAEDFDRQVQADVQFHTALVVGTGSERLRRMHEIIIGEVHLTMGLHAAHRTAPGKKIAAEHARVLKALKAGDVERAASVMRDHLDSARDRVLARQPTG
ncbi:GntR family transcriptional regulator [Kineococcus gynurae]|uniref:GntR family transcriptional regulator n=1 Tax=Kineococcus gynurae TaxID=452979 RepID=A0ABV5LMZ1_9ACTN